MTRLYRAGTIHDGVTSWSSSPEHVRDLYLAPEGVHTRVGLGGSEWHEIDVPDDAKVLDLRADPRAGLAEVGIEIVYITVPNMLHDLIRELVPQLRNEGFEWVAWVDGGAESWQDEWLYLPGGEPG